MEQEDYWLLHKGYYNRRLNDYRLVRWGVTPIVAAWTDKFNPFSNMPLADDEKLKKLIGDSNRLKRFEIDARNLDVLRRFKEAEKSN